MNERVETTRNSIFEKTVIVWLGAMLCCFLWGSAFPCIKLGYEWFDIASDDTATQILFAGYRFTLAGIFAIILGSIIQKQFIKPNKTSLAKVFYLSSLQTVAQYLFFYIGLANTTGVKASVVEGTNVFVAIFVASLIFHQETLTSRKLIGSIIGFCGVVLVNCFGSEALGAFTFTGDGFIFLSTIAYACSSVLLKRFSKTENPVMLSGYQFVVGGVIMTVTGLIMGGILPVVSGKGIAMLIYLAFVSAVAYSLWGILLKHNPISKVAVFGFMNPMFGVILSGILLNEMEALNGILIVSLILVCLGITIVNRESKAS